MKRSFRHSISFILDIEELNRQVGVEVNDSSVVEEVVEVLLLIVRLSSHDKIFREDIFCVRALEQAVLSVELQVPCDDKETMVHIIDDEQLDQVVDTSGDNILYPHFSTWGN